MINYLRFQTVLILNFSSQISNIEGLEGPIFADNQKPANQEDKLIDNESCVDSKTISGEIEFTKINNSMFNNSITSLIPTEEQCDCNNNIEDLQNKFDKVKRNLEELEISRKKGIEIFRNLWHIQNNKDIYENLWIKSQNENLDLMFTLTKSGLIIWDIFCQNFDTDLFSPTVDLLKITNEFYFNEIWNTNKDDLKIIWSVLISWIDLASYTDLNKVKFIFNFHEEMIKEKNIDIYLEECYEILKSCKNNLTANVNIEFIGITFDDYYELQEIIELNLLCLTLSKCTFIINSTYDHEEIL